MSATVERSNVSWRKRRSQEDADQLQIEMKKPRYYYYRLASESSRNSEEDTESIYSLQGRETDIVRDTSDTESKSGSDAEEFEYEIEYEVASLSESDHAIIGNSTSDSDNHVIFAAAIGAMCDSSLETWITDCEDSDNSSLDNSVVTRLGFSTCVQCKSQNDNPLYRYCEKCFQQTCKQCKKHKTYKCFSLCVNCHKDRKKLYPPRPRGYKKPRKKSNDPPVKLDTLRSCLSGLSSQSQDSGVASSQECPPLDLDQIVVPDKHLKPGTSEIPSIPDILQQENTSKEHKRDLRRKRQFSESSLSDFDIKKIKHSRKDKNGSQRHSRPSSRNASEAKPVTSNVNSLINNINQESSQTVSESSISLTETLSQTSTVTSFEFSQKSTETLSQTSTETLSQKSTDTLSQKSTDTLSQKSTETSFSLERSIIHAKSVSLSQASDVSTSTGYSSTPTTPESKELCIICNIAPKDSIFLHTNIGHQCCCYKCAKRTLHTIKRCPICNRPVNKVIKIFQS